MTPSGPNSARAAVLACGISQQLTEENMRTLSMAFVGGFAGASMAGNVGLLHAAPLPTNVASMKSSRQFDPGPVGRLARRGGHKCAACLEGGTAPRRADEHQLAIGGLPLSEDRLS